jgi:hypothetical protein
MKRLVSTIDDRPHYREPPAPARGGAPLKEPEFAEAGITDKSILANSGKWSEG